jgi:uncharacterized protein YuzE
MQLSYDSKHNIAYLRFRDKVAEVDTIHVSDALNIDLAPDGTIYGIELLNANEQLREKDGDKLVVINEVLGKRQEVKLSA